MPSTRPLGADEWRSKNDTRITTPDVSGCKQSGLELVLSGRRPRAARPCCCLALFVLAAARPASQHQPRRYRTKQTGRRVLSARSDAVSGQTTRATYAVIRVRTVLCCRLAYITGGVPLAITREVHAVLSLRLA